MLHVWPSYRGQMLTILSSSAAAAAAAGGEEAAAVKTMRHR